MLSHMYATIIIGSIKSSRQYMFSIHEHRYFSIAFISSVPSEVTQTVAKTLVFRGGQHSLKSDLRP